MAEPKAQTPKPAGNAQPNTPNKTAAKAENQAGQPASRAVPDAAKPSAPAQNPKPQNPAPAAKLAPPRPATGAKVDSDLAEPAPPRQQPGEAKISVGRTAIPAQTKGRHVFLLSSFVFVVLVPAFFTAFYLWTRAADQYASDVGFSVRTEEKSSAIELLGGITELSGSSSSDTDILYAFLSSQELVQRKKKRKEVKKTKENKKIVI